MEVDNVIKCPVCHKVFTAKKAVYKHMRNVHGCSVQITGKVFCNEEGCKFTSQRVTALQQHVFKEHGKSNEKEEHTFPTLTDFRSWKVKEEEESKSSFVQITGKRLMANGATRVTYYCHRSGYYKSTSTGKHRLKRQGSCKIDGTCTAMIVTTIKDNCVEVVYYKGHSGHSLDVGHLRLSEEDRLQISHKLAQGISVDAILDEVRDSSTPELGLSRLQLINRKDLHNIKREFGLNRKEQEHSNDADSVQLWVQEASEIDNESVLFYKEHGNYLDNCPLETNDFMLVIMTSAQKEVFLLNGPKIVCVDSTRGTSAQDFQLTTVITLDNQGEGFPVAFCLSNKTNSDAITVFFQSIKKCVGAIETDVFMSDGSPAFVNSWTKVMGESKQMFLCTWHIDKSWRQNLSKIPYKEKQALVYKSLRALLEESSETEFHKLLETFLTSCQSDEDTKRFGEYFQKHYAEKYLMWAYCFRKESPIITNMHLEAMHRVLKHVYFEGKVVKRVDKCIDYLVKLVRDKVLDNIRKYHLEASLIDISNIECISSQEWNVKSSNGADEYTVRKLDTRCKEFCEFTCTDCLACVHNYSCTCFESLLHSTMCKHVHAVISSGMEEVEARTVLVAENDGEICEAKFQVPVQIDECRISKIEEKLQYLLNLCKTKKIDNSFALVVDQKLDDCISLFNEETDTFYEPPNKKMCT